MYAASHGVEPGAGERERLILTHLPQVWLIARRIHDRLPVSVSIDDLVSVGTIGLIAAIDHYNPAQGVKLKTYAEYKIRGAMLDSLRELDWASRQRRRKVKEIEAAIAAAERRLKRTTTEEEIAAEMGVSLGEYHAALREVQGLELGSPLSGETADGHDRLKNAPAREEWSPAHGLERAELERALARGIRRLPEAERTVLSMYYLEELTLREIGEVMKLHESRISHLKSQGILRLRTYMAKEWPDRGEVELAG
ncbi:MAG: sigma-70 family RNA polymerase sigma factor [Bryobacteraceae bacterium]